MIEKTKYSQIYNDWVASGFQYKYAPSVDRIDNDIGYKLENIQCLTFLHNIIKYKQIKSPSLRLEDYNYSM